MSGTGEPVSKFEILFVCTGNICRSPLAERLLRERLHEAGARVAEQYYVHSAGVAALVDHPMDEHAAVALAGYGGSAEGFVARRITERLVESAGLVLTADKGQRAHVLRDHPTAMRRTFTLREFASLCEAIGSIAHGSGPDRLVRQAALHRSSTRVSDYDVPDPYRRTDAEHALAASLIAEAMDVIAPALAGAVASSG